MKQARFPLLAGVAFAQMTLASLPKAARTTLWVVPALLALRTWANETPVAILGALLSILVFVGIRRGRKLREDTMRALSWNAAVTASDPNTVPVADFALNDGERLLHATPSRRFVWAKTRSVTRAGTKRMVTGAAIGGLLAGRVGMFAGMAARGEVSRTQEYDLVLDDEGTLNVTDRRVIFFGKKARVAYDVEQLEKIEFIGAERVVFHAGARQQGEEYEIDSLTMILALSRRGGLRMRELGISLPDAPNIPSGRTLEARSS